MEILNGKIIEKKYQLIESIGKGGMGAVYLSKDLKLNTYWAIKVIEKHEDGEDLLAEPNILKVLQHPLLPRITDISEDEKYFYIIMDFIDGRTLESIAVEQGVIEEEIVVEWAKSICSALDYLHNLKPNPIIYRDMKPDNVMLTKDGSIKIIDFGIAREFKVDASEDTTYLGTRGYAAPEQYRINNSQTDARTDIYGLGVTIYRLLTGKTLDEPPYEIRPVREFNSAFSEGIEFIIMKCTELDPKLRYNNIKELNKDLENVKNIGINFERRSKIRKCKIIALACGICFSLSLISNGFFEYSRNLKDNYNQYISEGINCRNKMDFKGAIAKFEQAQKYIDVEKRSYHEVVKTYIGMWSLDEGLRYLNQSVQRENSLQKDDYTNYLFGKLYFLKGNYNEAIRYFKDVKSITNVESDFDELNLLSNELINLDDKNEEFLVKAIEEFEKFVDENTSDKVMTLNLYLATADIYSQCSSVIEDSIDRQIKILKKADNISKGEYFVIERLALAYREKARNIRLSDISRYEYYLKKSLETYDKCLAIQPGVDVYMNIGDIYLELKKYSAAESFYKDMIEANKDNYQGYLKMARLYFIQGRRDEAREYLLKGENCNNLRENDPQYNSLKKSLE